jgi:uncharacterized protein
VIVLVVLAACAPGVAAVLATAAPAVEVQVPQNDGWVTDLAGMLSSDEEAELELLMESYRQGSGHEIALLTVPSLAGETIEGYALAVGRKWGLGREGVNDGALLLVAKAERELRIEVGRGLEGTLTDSICGRIIRDVITPAFKQGRFGAGLRAGVEALQAAAGGDYADLPPPRRSTGKVHDLRGVLFGLFIMLLLLRGLVRAGRRGRRRGSLASPIFWGSVLSHAGRGGFGGRGSRGFGGGGGFGGFGGGGGFSGGGASGRW